MAGATAHEDQDGKLPVRLKLAYGLGEVGEGLKTAALETFLFFYYVQVVGLSGALTGLALLLALLFDAITDPMVGTWSDRTKTRIGRRHPFLYAAPVPLAIALACLFSPPALGQWQLFAWLTGFTMAARLAMTLYFIPHMALGAELATDFGERVSVGAYRVFFGYVGRMAALALGFAVFFANRPGVAHGQLDRSAYPPFAIAMGVLVIAAVILSALGTQRAALRNASLNPVPPATRGAMKTLLLAFRSPSFAALVLALLVLFIYAGVQGALALHMNTYFWQLPPDKIQLLFYANIVGYIIAIPLVKPLAGKLDKKRAYVAGILFHASSGSAPAILRLLGLFPDNGDPLLLPLLMASTFGAGLGGAVPLVLSAAMLADVADEFDLAHRGRSEGLFFGANAFCRKAALGLGGGLAGLIIDLIRFPTKAAPGTVEPETLNRLAVAYGPVMFAVVLAGLTIMIPYKLDRRRHQAIQADLMARRTAS